jgi:hypothetical protein
MRNHAGMTRAQILLVAVVGIGAAAMAESYLGSTRYGLNGVTYAVPHKYEFTRNFSLPWLAGVKGLAKEPDESVWLLIPASELSSGVRGYKRWFRGYSGNVEADMVVNVLGGKEAREFPADRESDLAKVTKELDDGALRQRDSATGWDRVYWLIGEKGTPGEGGSLFYLIPGEGLQTLPSNWRVPSCQGSPDIKGNETIDCGFTISSGGLSFDFTLREENLGTASRIPSYVRARLDRWRV